MTYLMTLENRAVRTAGFLASSSSLAVMDISVSVV